MTKHATLLLLTTLSLLPGYAETLTPTEEVTPQQPTHEDESEPWETVLTHPNQAWRVRYMGRRLGTSFFPERIVLENPTVGKSYLFTPAEAEHVTNTRFCLTEAWSPDGRRCILPNGRFEGFILLQPEGDQLGEMRSVCVHLSNGPALWHEFIRWDGSDAFIFSVGLSGDQIPFRFDLNTGDYSAVNPEQAYFRPRTRLISPAESARPFKS